jgi:hypothetical protein
METCSVVVQLCADRSINMHDESNKHIFLNFCNKHAKNKAKGRHGQILIKQQL